MAWLITVPEASTNMVLNPSAEKNSNYAAHNGATVARSTTYSRFGDYSYSVTLGATNRGINLTTSALTATDSYVTFYVRGTITGTLQTSLNGGTNYTAASIIGGSYGRWVRYGALVVAAQITASGTSCILRDTANDTLIYIDGVQVEQLGYYTDYIDGTLPGCKWSGLFHGSTSSRDAQYRLSGRQRDLETVYNIRVRQMPGAGLPIIRNNIQAFSLQPGGEFQSYNVDVRRMSLVLAVHGTSTTQLHSRRKEFFNLIKPDMTRGAQPFRIWYTGANANNKYVYADFRYDGGGEFGEVKSGGNSIESDGAVPINIVASDPFWYEDNQQTDELDFTDSISAAAYGLRRHDGRWKALGTGFNAATSAVVEDAQRGRIYFGGAFTTANGVTVNRITYWDGNTFVAMGSGVAGGQVHTIAIAANGDVWVGGAFTTVDGTAGRNYIARWNVSSSTWTHFGTTGTGTVYSLAIDSTGLVYAGGSFTNWGGDADQDYITSYNGSAWVDVGASPFSANEYTTGHNSFAVDGDDNLWVGTTGAVGAGAIRKWNGSAWSLIAQTDTLALPRGVGALMFSSNGLLYISGNFVTIGGTSANYIAVYNGASFYPLDTGLNNPSNVVKQYGSSLIVGGFFTSAGGITTTDAIALWNGTAWTHLDTDLPASSTTYSLAISGEDIYMGFNTTGTATASGITSITSLATAETYPRLSIINGNTSGSCVLQWLENQSSKHRLYFNLTVQAGETVWFNLSESGKSLVSDWRGLITDNPLKASDVTNWKLLPTPSTNTIATFISGTTTSVKAILHWIPRHWSIDGAAE